MSLQTKSINDNGSKNHHKFTLSVVEESINEANNTSILSFTFKLSPVTSGYDWSGWSDKIKYTVDIGSKHYSGSIGSYNGSSTVTLKSDSNVAIEHDEDGTKSIGISFNVTDSSGQSYTCGNASKSSTMTLTNISRNVARVKVNGAWKQAFSWFKVNGTWKRCTLWKKVNGVWKRGV